MEEEIVIMYPEKDYSVPWTVRETWLGLAIFVLVLLATAATSFFLSKVDDASFLSLGMVISELVFLLPVIVLFTYKKISLKTLGFHPFDSKSLGIGCGLLIVTYLVTILHNIIIFFLGITTQGELINQIFASLKNPFWFFIVGIVLAPLVEEIFFRGFLFAGFRQRMGWNKAALLSSGIFGLAHFQLAAFIPTFLLGYLFSYLFHRSNSIWPGIIFHAIVNSFGLCAIFALSQLQGFSV